MGATAQGRTRGKGSRGTRLVERDWELSALEGALAEARAGAGATVFVEGSPGSGKSVLLAEAARLAAHAGMVTAQGRGLPLERDFLFGLAIQLFEPLWLAYGVDERPALLAGAANLAAPLLHGIAPAGGGDGLPLEPYGVIHGLFRVACNVVLSPPRPHRGLLILADDAHLADALSLRFLAYLADRLHELPIVLLVATGAGQRCAEPKALARLRRAAGDSVLRPRPLSHSGVAAIARSAFPEADDAFCADCAELTGGNPFLTSELIETLRAEEMAPDTYSLGLLADSVPSAVSHSVRARLEELSADARAVAASVSAFETGASIADVSRHSGLDVQTVSRTADELSAIEMLAPGVPLRFAHPLIQSAVAASLSPLERADATRRAKQITAYQQAQADRMANRILTVAAERETEAMEALRDAARDAWTSGSPRRAVELLEGALTEVPGADLKSELLAVLDRATREAGVERAAEALASSEDAGDRLRHRAEQALEKGRHLYLDGRYREAAAVLDAGLQELGDRDEELAQRLRAAYVSAGSLIEELQSQTLDRRSEMLRGLSGAPAPDERSALAHAAVHDALRGASRAEVRLMVDLAWGSGALLHAEPAGALSWPLLLGALVFADELERELELCDTVLATARRGASPSFAATVDACRAAGLYGQGRVAEAQAVAESALAAREAANHHAPIALAVLTLCHLERARTEQAETVLSVLERQSPRDSIRHPVMLELRARLRLVQHRAQDALDDALSAGRELRGMFAKATPGAVPWRSTAALAHLRLGDARRARKLAEEELHDARRIGLTSTVMRDLRVLGLATGGATGLELLTEAIRVGETNPLRIEYMRGLIDYGAALRRANRRSDARAPLRRGLELSYKHGADVLAGRAHVELIASGARPRRAAFTGVEALTPSQRRVAGLAAQGLTTRQIAETLYVTPKTVEFHLRSIYQKLDVSSRSELTSALAVAA